MTLPVGVSGEIEQIVIPGPRLRVRPVEPRQPLIVRIDGVYPHGADWRYDLVVYGLEPGEYNVVDYLEHEDGRVGAKTEPVPVRIVSVLPTGRVLPNPLPLKRETRYGSYRVWMVVVGAVWFAGLVAILVAGRWPVRRAQQRAGGRPVSLADRLQPLVAKACRGELGREERAALERMLIGYWRRRLGLESVPADEVLRVLREHAEAGPLLCQLEAWLHRPQPGNVEQVRALLAPYENVRDPEEETHPNASAMTGSASAAPAER
ncbi:MAG: hypothetical protein GXP27_19275 [Planctomycetes bacterium]|nr:hypothetical protein [Planctomycetota bacterium]